MSIRPHEYATLERKLGLKSREGRDRLSWFEHEGKVITRTRRSHGSGELPHSHSIRQQLKLSEDQLRDVLDCSIDRDGYIEILRGKGLLG